jgi:diaminopimelate decarboxylase
MNNIAYKENVLFCEDIPVNELAEEYGTPLYVYSKNQIIENFRSLDSALQSVNHLVCYALKANANHYILKLLAAEGAGADIVSAGELHLALKAGFSPDKIVFAGVGKREDEIEYALKQNIFSFNVESVEEMHAVSRSALRLGKKARISLRINPDVDAQSHPYITTGLQSNKFGIEASKAFEVYKYAATLSSLELIGIHTHIGSQITKVEPFIETAKFSVNLVEKLREAGIHLTHIDLGGGYGVQYVNTIKHEAIPLEETAEPDTPAAAEFVKSLLPILQSSGCSVWIEPGRSIIANAGVLITRVIYVKENSAKKFIIVDGGMNDLLRPSLYNAYHQIVPTAITTYEHQKADVVGPICESGDYFARDRLICKTESGGYLAILTSGAYGFVQGSNYCGRPRPAEILVNGDRVRVIRQRQKMEELE